MARRLPSSPPILPGFTFIHVLGMGGFADVFLYEQNMPRRQVAVKVMLSEMVDEQVRQMFSAEANLMAQLSAHPSILTIYQAGVSADGRPYLVMELCSAALAERYRREPIPVPEVLKIAVQIGSAVETAHRSGVLHRDLKPSNILLTAYGHPVLSDFGIASTISLTHSEEESVGLSVPWSAPEVLLDETPGTIASEVWAFGATIYSLLAGRSPFELPGGSNASTDLMSRITRAKPQPIGRPDIPASLDELLRRTMAKKPEQRPASALAVVRELQRIEEELGLPPTAAEVAMDDWASTTITEREDRTRVRPAQAVHAAGPGRRRRRAAASAAAGDRMRAADERTGISDRFAALPRRGVQTVTWVLLAASLLVVVLGVAAVTVLLRAGSGTGIPTVTNIAATVSGTTATFSWPDPGVASGDRYQIQVGGSGAPALQQSTRFVVDGKAGTPVCITVTVTRSGKTGDPSAQKCVDVTGG